MKYIIQRKLDQSLEAKVFQVNCNHSAMIDKDCEVYSAGFCKLDNQDEWEVYGSSWTLNSWPKRFDAQILEA